MVETNVLWLWLAYLSFALQNTCTCNISAFSIRPNKIICLFRVTWPTLSHFIHFSSMKMVCESKNLTSGFNFRKSIVYVFALVVIQTLLDYNVFNKDTRYPIKHFLVFATKMLQVFCAEVSKMFPYWQNICDDGSSKQTCFRRNYLKCITDLVINWWLPFRVLWLYSFMSLSLQITTIY